MVRFEVKAETFARLREARAALDAEHGERLDDDAFIAALCERALAPVVADEAQQGRAKFQVATIVCEECKRGWQSGGGATVSVGDAEVARAECDAQRIGSLEANEPARATQDVSPKVRRFVWRRDHGRCVVAGCRSARNLEIHHLKARADGGSHDASNLALLCGAHHAALHAGTLVLGAATKPARESRYDAAVMRVQAKSALVNMGWKAGIAAAAVDEALASLAPDGDIGGLMRAALRCCPV